VANPGEAQGRVLVGVFNYDRKATKDVEVKLDLAALKLQGKTLVMSDLYKNFSAAEANSPDPNVTAAMAMSNPGLGAAAEFDPATGVLRIKGVGAHRGRFVGVGAIDPRRWRKRTNICRRELPSCRRPFPISA
jgi:hypothetical protein